MLPKDATSPSATGETLSASICDHAHSARSQSLIDELEDAITKQNLRSRRRSCGV
jgi:hypothetical protein